MYQVPYTTETLSSMNTSSNTLSGIEDTHSEPNIHVVSAAATHITSSSNSNRTIDRQLQKSTQRQHHEGIILGSVFLILVGGILLGIKTTYDIKTFIHSNTLKSS